jgi:hypothetical protein
MAPAATHWHVDLDDETGSDRVFRVGAAEKVTVGYLIRAYDRKWIVDFVDRERKRARAVEVRRHRVARAAPRSA